MPDPIEDLESFGTGGINVNPLDAADVRRQGDRRRVRRNAGIAAAVALAVVAAVVPLTLALQQDDGRTAPPVLQAPTPTSTPSPAPTPASAWITYPEPGLQIDDPADVDELVGTSKAFRAFAAGQVRDAIAAGASCPGAAHGITVERYSPLGAAEGGVNDCGGYRALWLEHDGAWIEAQGTQDAWDCDTLSYYDVPAALDLECFDESDGTEFGPDFVGWESGDPYKLRLGMTTGQAKAAGAIVQGATEGCEGVYYTTTDGIPEDVDGWFSATGTKGLVALFARPGTKTPEGIGLGSSESDVRAAYPALTHGEDGTWRVPLSATSEYQLLFTVRGTVDSLVLARPDQDCFVFH